MASKLKVSFNFCPDITPFAEDEYANSYNKFMSLSYWSKSL